MPVYQLELKAQLSFITLSAILIALAPRADAQFAASTPSMNSARWDATATLLPNGRVLIAGGSNSSGYLSSTELFDPATNTFAAATPSMNVARRSATATLLPNAKVLIAGGFGNGGVLSSTELYDPVT